MKQPVKRYLKVLLNLLLALAALLLCIFALPRLLLFFHAVSGGLAHCSDCKSAGALF